MAALAGAAGELRAEAAQAQAAADQALRDGLVLDAASIASKADVLR